MYSGLQDKKCVAGWWRECQNSFALPREELLNYQEWFWSRASNGPILQGRLDWQHCARETWKSIKICKTELSAPCSSERGKSRLKTTETRTGRCVKQGCQRAELGTLPPTESLCDFLKWQNIFNSTTNW